jgi:ribosomal protein L39E
LCDTLASVWVAMKSESEVEDNGAGRKRRRTSNAALM